MKILYRDGYLFQLKKDTELKTGIKPEFYTGNGFVKLLTCGTMRVSKGYAWDGPTAVPSWAPYYRRMLPASLAHDAGYQMCREGMLDHKVYREQIDNLFYSILLADGVPKVIAWLMFQAVRKFGKPFADPSSEKPFMVAP